MAEVLLLLFFSLGTYRIPTWTMPIFLLLVITALVPGTSFLGHASGLLVGYICMYLSYPTVLHALASRSRASDTGSDGLGYLRFLAPPERILRWIEGKLNLLVRVPHYVSVDQKIYGRYGVLPTPNSAPPFNDQGGPARFTGTGANGQRLGA